MNTLLENLGTFTVGAGLIAWLIRSLIKHYLSRDVEEFKSRLQIITDEHLHRFERTYDKRLEITATAYGKLRKMHRCFKPLVSPQINITEGDRKRMIEEMNAAYNDFTAYFTDNELFIPHEIFKEIENTHSKIKDAMGSYNTWNTLSENSVDKFKYFKSAMTATEECETIFTRTKEKFGNFFSKDSLNNNNC